LRHLPRPALALIAMTLLASACGETAGNDTPSASRPTLPPVVTTAGAGERVALQGEPFVAVRTLPAAALSADVLEPAGTARSAMGDEVPLARADAGDVASWELVSAADDGWRVWRPAVIEDVLADAGSGAQLIEVEQIDWPDACLGAPDPGELCATVITPGYRVIVEQRGERIEYHTARTSAYRRVRS
jgi:hypothetical protein